MTSKIQIYSYASCSTCRKALKWLSEKKISYALIDIVESPPGKEILRNALDQLGNRKFLFNTSGVSYRALGAEVVKSMSDEDALEALASDGKLIKRPFVISNTGKILVGFKQEAWDESLIC